MGYGERNLIKLRFKAKTWRILKTPRIIPTCARNGSLSYRSWSLISISRFLICVKDTATRTNRNKHKIYPSLVLANHKKRIFLLRDTSASMKEPKYKPGRSAIANHGAILSGITCHYQNLSLVTDHENNQAWKQKKNKKKIMVLISSEFLFVYYQNLHLICFFNLNQPVGDIAPCKKCLTCSSEHLLFY